MELERPVEAGLTPLDNIRNTQQIRAVVAAGRVFRRSDLDRLLPTVEALGRQSSNESEE